MHAHTHNTHTHTHTHVRTHKCCCCMLCHYDSVVVCVVCELSCCMVRQTNSSHMLGSTRLNHCGRFSLLELHWRDKREPGAVTRTHTHITYTLSTSSDNQSVDIRNNGNQLKAHTSCQHTSGLLVGGLSRLELWPLVGGAGRLELGVVRTSSIFYRRRRRRRRRRDN